MGCVGLATTHPRPGFCISRGMAFVESAGSFITNPLFCAPSPPHDTKNKDTKKRQVVLVCSPKCLRGAGVRVRRVSSVTTRHISGARAWLVSNLGSPFVKFAVLGCLCVIQFGFKCTNHPLFSIYMSV